MKFFYNDVNLVRAKPRASLVEAAARTEEAALGFLAAGLGLAVLGLFLGRAAVLALGILYQAEGPRPRPPPMFGASAFDIGGALGGAET